MKRSHQNAFDVLMENKKKPQYDYVGIPVHLKGLVKKCPQWRETIINMCGGQCREIFMKMSYKDIEREVTNRNNLMSIHQSIKKKTIDFCESLQKRLQQAVDGKSFPKSEQERYSAASFEKVRSLKARINGFIYGGKIYMEHLKASKHFDGLLQLKMNASKRGETFFYRQLQVIFDEVNSVTSFLCTDYESIIEFVNRRCNITRQFHLDLQAKGVQGMATRNSAKTKRDKSLKSLGKAPSFFVPLANILLSVQSEPNDKREAHCESTDNDDVRVVSDDEENEDEKEMDQTAEYSSTDEPSDVEDNKEHAVGVVDKSKPGYSSDLDTFNTDEPWGGDFESDGDGEVEKEKACEKKETEFLRQNQEDVCLDEDALLNEILGEI